jgi:hypothetical protein
MTLVNLPMDEVAHLPAGVLSDLLRACEAALTIRSRSDFFLWSQGPLQAVLPHDLMLGLRLDEALQVVHLESLYAVVLEPRVKAFLAEKKPNFLMKAVEICDDYPQGYWALSTNTKTQALADHADLVQDLQDLGFSDCIFQNSGLFGDSSRSFFVLLGKVQPLAHAPIVLQFLLPHLHMALSRCIGAGVSSSAVKRDSGTGEAGPSDRQLEILEWVKSGKTNFEISVILGISELTVKNHLQNLFKKLNVHNRAQAVAKVFTRS